jgi:diaminohydroxyphosphoribosylaminopyrimidine deaminase/5-amino-6-(5-phosphoribosylamino)uracil reductase
MVGGGTARTDDPLLTDRSGKKRRRALVRVVIEQYLDLSPESQLAQTTNEGPVMIFASGSSNSDVFDELKSRGIEVVMQRSALDLLSVLNELGQRSIQSVLVEGGSFLAGLLLEGELVNKMTFFVAPMIIGGQDAPSAIGGDGAEKISDAWQLENVQVAQFGRDFEITGYPRQNPDLSG